MDFELDTMQGIDAILKNLPDKFQRQKLSLGKLVVKVGSQLTCKAKHYACF